MSELAFNINGESFEVPANAAGWRVRRMRAKGSPEVVYAREGQPLVLAIDADIADLRAEVDATGRYRLDLVDQNNKAIDGAPSGYVQVNVDVQPASTSEPATTRSSLASSPSNNLIMEAMRMQSMIACSVVDRFPQMMEAAATLLRAADGAGLPAREPRHMDEEVEIDDGEEESPAVKPAFDLNALVAQLVPMIIMGLGSGKTKMPGLAELLDWRKAAPETPPSAMGQRGNKQSRLDSPGDVAPSSIPENAHDVLPPIDPQTMAHFMAVQSALTPEESTIAREVASDLSAAELRAWFDELSKLSVPDAVQKVRKLISGASKAGAAS